MGGREDLLARFAAFAFDHKSPVTLTVTHHIEEIPAGQLDALLLKDGKLLLADPLAK
jgi:iron complex transport system ATP-binding protein